MCSCSGSCSCAPQVPRQPPVRSEPAPLPEITFGFVVLPAGDDPTVLITGVPPVYHVEVGFPLGPTPAWTVEVTTLAPGSQATASIDSTDPLNLILQLGIPAGQDGTNGISAFTSLTTGFDVPAVDAVTNQVDVGDTSAFPVGTWVAISGAGAPGYSVGRFVVASVINATSLTLRNPGTTDGISPAEGYPDGLPQNAAEGIFCISNGAPNQISMTGRPGPRGPGGTNGVAQLMNIVYTAPVAAPVSDDLRTVVYFNAAPPNVATVARVYTWNGASWDGGPNFAGPGGVQAFSGSADPNTTPPSTSNIGDLYFRTAGPIYTMYQRVSSSTWSVIWGPINTFGLTTNEIDHTSGPGPVDIDTAYFSTKITADKSINLGGLDHDDTNYQGQGQWTVQILNTDASAIDIEFAIGRWEQDPALTIPDTIGAGESFFITFIRNMDSGLYVITHAFSATAASS